jgi:hypothetical protein
LSAAAHRSLSATAAAHRPLLPETPSVSLASVSTLQLCLLSRRDEVSVLFEIFDYLFRNNLSLEPAQRRFDRFVRINCNKSHLSSHLLSAKIQKLPKEQTNIKPLHLSKLKFQREVPSDSLLSFGSALDSVSEKEQFGIWQSQALQDSAFL